MANEEQALLTQIQMQLISLAGTISSKNTKAQKLLKSVQALIDAEQVRLATPTRGTGGSTGATGGTGGTVPPPKPPTTGKPVVGNCTSLGGQLPFTADSWWNRDVSKLPLLPNSAAIVAAIGPGAAIHPDFGTTWAGQPNGIPYTIVPHDQPLIAFVGDLYPDDCDNGGYPIPASVAIEGPNMNPGDDHHVIIAQLDANGDLDRLFEMYQPTGKAPNFTGGFGCQFNLKKGDHQRPAGKTSADAAGLPLFPGLVKFDEVMAAVKYNDTCGHAFRFTISPGYSTFACLGAADHVAGNNAGKGPFGLHLRLKASYVIEPTWPPEVQAILRTLKVYGMVMADNGGPFYLSGAPDNRWNDGNLAYLGDATRAPGIWEAIDNGPLRPMKL